MDKMPTLLSNGHLDVLGALLSGPPCISMGKGIKICVLKNLWWGNKPLSEQF